MVLCALLLLACQGGDPGDSGPGESPVVVDHDADGDGWEARDDCDDADPAVHPYAADDTCDDRDQDCDGAADDDAPDADGDDTPDCRDLEACDGVDNDGDGQVDEGIDLDADGADGCTADCDDLDPERHPGAAEVDDGVDQDCDGLVDEGRWAAGDLVVTELLVDPLHTMDGEGEWIELVNRTDRTVWLDGLVLRVDGTATVLVQATGPVDAGERVLLGVSADPARNGGVRPRALWTDLPLANSGGALAVEADGVVLDEVRWRGPVAGASLGLDLDVADPVQNDDDHAWCEATLAWADADLGSPGASNEACTTVDRDGDGYAPADGDCDETDATIHPGAEDPPYDDLDQDCDGTLNNDADADGYEDFSRGGTDCDDTDPDVHPGADEVCSGIDEDCDRLVDDADPGTIGQPSTWWDDDGDGWGDPALAFTLCDPPAEAVTLGDDCDDTDPAVNPGMVEICGNEIDDDCDGGPNGCGLTGAGDVGETDGWLIGSQRNGTLGYRVAAGPDLTGDGVPDLVASAPGATGANGASGGVVHLLSADTSGSTWDVDAAARLYGGANADSLGSGLASGGDLDGDGLADLVLGAFTAEEDEGSQGMVYVVQGPVTGEVDVESTAWCTLVGEVGGDSAGSPVEVADLDGDGDLEVIVGALSNDSGGSSAGATYVVDPSAGSSDLADARLTVLGERASDFAGRALGAVDWDGDGVAELVVTSSDADISTTNGGAVWILDATGSGETNLAYADVRLVGTEASGALGGAVAAGADLDGDGRGDLAVGAPGVSGASSGSGVVYLVPGGTETAPVVDVALVVRGESTNESFGLTVAVGDYDGDGQLDVLAGAPYADLTASNAGVARIAFGPFAASNDPTISIHGLVAADTAGAWVATVPDADADGDAELLLGIPGSDEGETAGGMATWAFGGAGM